MLPEATLPSDVLDRLPAATPPPPWCCVARAVVWWQRGSGPVPDGSKALPLTAGAMVDYLDSPVGPYREVFAGTVLAHVGRPSLHVPFIAVDSTDSLQGGRATWRLPKVLASFSGSPIPTGATGDGWSVRVSSRVVGPPVPVLGPFRAVQDGLSASITVHGTVRAALVRVAATGPTLAGWLGEGSHAGFVARGTVLLGVPTRTAHA